MAIFPRQSWRKILSKIGLAGLLLATGLLLQLNWSEEALAQFECHKGLRSSSSKMFFDLGDIQAGKWVRTCDSTNYKNVMNSDGVVQDVSGSAGGIYYWSIVHEWYGQFNKGLSVMMDNGLRPGDIPPPAFRVGGEALGRYDAMFGQGADATRTAIAHLPMRFVKRACTANSAKMCYRAIGLKTEGLASETFYWLLLDEELKRPIVNGQELTRPQIDGGTKYEFDETVFADRFIEAPAEFQTYPYVPVREFLQSRPYGIREQELVIDGIHVRPIPPTLDTNGDPVRATHDDKRGNWPVALALRIIAGHGHQWDIPYTVTVKGGAVLEGGAVVGERAIGSSGIYLENTSTPQHSGDLTVNVIDGTIRTWHQGIRVHSNERSAATIKLQDKARVEQFDGPTDAAPGSSVTPGWITTSGDYSHGINSIMWEDSGSARINTPLAIRTTGDKSHGVAIGFGWPGRPGPLLEATRARAREAGITNPAAGINLVRLIELSTAPHLARDPDVFRPVTRASILAAIGADGSPNEVIGQYIHLHPETGRQAINDAIAILRGSLITDEMIEGAKQYLIDLYARGSTHYAVWAWSQGDEPGKGATVIVGGRPGISTQRTNSAGIVVHLASQSPENLAETWVGREGDFAGDTKSDEVDFDGDGVVDARVYRSKLIVDEEIQTTGMESHGVLVEIGDGRAFDLTVDADISTIGEGSDAVRVTAASTNELRATGAVSVVVGEGIVVSATGADSNGIRILGDGSKTVRVDGTVTSGSGTRAGSNGIRFLSDGSRTLADGSGTGAGVHLEGGGTVIIGASGMVSATGTGADGIRILGDGAKTVRVDGTVTGGSGTGAGVHLEGGGTVIIGTSGRVSAASDVAILVPDPSDLVIIVTVSDLDDLEAISQALLERVAGEIRNVGGETEIRAEDDTGTKRELFKDDQTVEALPGEGIKDIGYVKENGRVRRVTDFAPRAFVYEALPRVLLDLDRTPSLQERAGGQWNGPTWARLQVGHGSHEPDDSTTGADYDWNTWRFDAGMEGLLRKGEDGSRWLAGVSVHYGAASADISGRPVFGSDTDKGDLDMRGFGMGASTTWRRANGFYLDGQATVSRYNIDFASARRGLLREDVDAHVFGLGLEAGRQMELWDGVMLTPHAQLAWSRIDLDSFTDSLGSRISLAEDDSLQGRIGLSVEDQSTLGNYDVHIHGTLLLEQEFEDETVVRASGERLAMEAEPTRAVMEAGATYDWGDGTVVLYGRGRAAVRFGGDGNGQEFGGTVGLKAKF